MIIFNKDRLLKYGEYLKETLDPWKIKMGIKSFNRIPEDKYTIHGDLKDLSNDLNSQFVDIKLPYTKLLLFGGIEIDLKIIQSNRYYSSIDWIKFLKGDYEMVIEVIKDWDTNYMISLIIHEIRHMIDFADENLNNGLSSFDIDRNLRNFGTGNFVDFFKLVYISLEHELVARNNQIYPYIKFKNLGKTESINILKKSFIWQAIDELKSFDYLDFINKFNLEELIELTNKFIIDCLNDNENKIENKDELVTFFKIWNEYFNETSNKWENLLLREIDIIYERKQYSIEYSITNNYANILNDIWNEIRTKSKFFK